MKKRNKVLTVCLLLILELYLCLHSVTLAQENNISWDCVIHVNESGGKHDDAMFGEATGASGGTPGDVYDVVKPPAPMVPYLRIWFDDNLPSPYDLLWKDYRSFPDTTKTWNVTIQWVPSDYTTSTIVTIQWNSTDIITSEYSSMSLYIDSGAFACDMFLDTSYTFNCPANIPQVFQIVCRYTNNPPDAPSIVDGDTVGYHGISYVYTSSCFDPDGDALYYQFYWGDSILSDWLGPYSSGENIQASYKWSIPGYFQIKVHSKDMYGLQGDWSSILLVEMMNRAPSQPNTPFPHNDASGIKINTTCSWTGTDPDGDPLTHTIYFGLTNPPDKLIDNQSSFSFYPGTLSHKTIYYWKIVSWDGFGMSTSSPVWSFTTMAGNDSEPPQNNTNHTNQEPIADGSLSEQQGFMGSFLVFNGSRSYDPDGYITKWSWDFADGTTSVGERTTHVYQRVGRFEVALTVTDNEGATATDMISIHVVSANLPPSKPVMNGTRIGSKNTPYTFTLSASDVENDYLQYTISWGDGSENTSLFLPNGTTWSASHSWAGSGKYHLTAEATDNITVSELTSMDVHIDVLFIKNLGFLYDSNNDGSFDSLYVNSTGIITAILKTSDGAYYLDTDGDGKWDQLYNPNNGSLTAVFSGVTTIEDPWFFIIIIAVAVLIIAGIVYLYKKNYF